MPTMTEANKEPEKKADSENEVKPVDTTEPAEEWVRRKVVPPHPEDLDPSEGDDRSPGGSGR